MTQVGAAIVTGASRGIGREIAKRVAAMGYPVVVNYASNEESALSVVSEIQNANGRAVAVAGDISDPKTAIVLFERANEEFGPVEVLINNAGVATSKWTTMSDLDDDTYDHVFDVNTRGTFNMLREASRQMTEGGRIVNFSSTLVAAPLPGLSLYAASKAAVEAFTAVLARELRGRKITVNCIAPGATTTEVFLQGKSEETIQKFVETSPMERLGTPQDIASVVAFLVSPDSGWVNGQVIRVNGGVV